MCFCSRAGRGGSGRKRNIRSGFSTWDRGHREAALQRLKSLIREEKTEAELIYLYTCVKDIYTASRPGEREEALGEWYEATYLFPEDKKRLIALVLLESAASGRMIFRGRKQWRKKRRAGGSGAARHTGPAVP